MPDQPDGSLFNGKALCLLSIDTCSGAHDAPIHILHKLW